jgi:transposase
MKDEIKKKCGRRYDREFKRDAVALVRSGRTITEVARDLGVTQWSVGRWLRELENGKSLREPGTLAVETAEQRELRRLRQQNDYLQRQRDILKKALAILSAEMPPNDTPSSNP